MGLFEAKPPPSSYKQPLESRGGRPLGTAAGAEARPLTSNKAVGFTSKLAEKGNELLNTKTKFDVNRKPDNSPEEQIKKLEKEINGLIEDSAAAKNKGNPALTQATSERDWRRPRKQSTRRRRSASCGSPRTRWTW